MSSYFISCDILKISGQKRFSYFGIPDQHKAESIHTLILGVFLYVGIHTIDLEAFRNILGFKLAIFVGNIEDIFFLVIIVDELDVINIGSSWLMINFDAYLLDRLVFHVVSNDIIAIVATIVELGTNAALEAKLNTTERVFSFACNDLLELQRPLLIITFTV